MILQPASRKEVTRIAVGSAVCTAVMLLVFAALSLTGLVAFGMPVVLGGVLGALVAVFNFALMCLTVQNVTGMTDQKALQARFQLSYNARLLLQAGWCLAAYLLPQIQVVAAALPLLFPRVVIYYLQITGKFQPDSSDTPTDPKSASDPTESER